MSEEILVVRCGTVPYAEAWQLQLRLEARRQAGQIPDVLLLLEHPPTYTRGRRSQPQELPMGIDWYEARGIEVLDTNRGGFVTYHGPGQLVAYPIVSLAPYGGDVHEFIRRIERTAIAALGEHGVTATVIDGLTGVWTEGEHPGSGAGDAESRKIASIGLHISRGVTTHGLSVNVSNDLQPFEWIVPCGIEGLFSTSLARELGEEQDLGAFAGTVARRYAETFERELVPAGLGELDEGDLAPRSFGGMPLAPGGSPP
jgi:lipoyl(octanoyl) transferase